MSDVHVMAKPDGRNRRRQETRAKVVASCRELMRAGDFRPSLVAVAGHAACSIRTAFQHFGSVEALHLEAIADGETRGAILERVLGDVPAGPTLGVAIVRAIVLGRAA